jgi:hypothetical protein
VNGCAVVVVYTVRVAVDVSVVVRFTVVDAVFVTVFVLGDEEPPSIAHRAASVKSDPFLHMHVNLNLSVGNFPHNPTRISEVRPPQSCHGDGLAA